MFSLRFIAENWLLLAIGFPVVASSLFDSLTIFLELFDDWRKG
jgi:hypothetical protein